MRCPTSVAVPRRVDSDPGESVAVAIVASLRLVVRPLRIMSMFERIFQIFVGVVLFIAGAGIIYTFQTLDWHRGHDMWDGGFLLIVEAYSIVGSLFVLLGLRYAFGKRSVIEQWIARSLRHFVVVVVLLSLAISAALIFSVR